MLEMAQRVNWAAKNQVGHHPNGLYENRQRHRYQSMLKLWHICRLQTDRLEMRKTHRTKALADIAEDEKPLSFEG